MDVLGLFSGIGPWEVILILFLALLIFGAKRLPEIARAMGRSLKEFKEGTKGLADDVKQGIEGDDKTPSGEQTKKDE